MAESNTLTLKYQPVFKGFDVDFSEDNRTITVGPLHSFMGQMIPDGIEVALSIYQNKELINSNIKTSYNGFVNFNLKTAVYKKETYDIKIDVGRVDKKIEKITLW